MRRRITQQQRQAEKEKRLQALRIGRTYAPKLAKARRKELERVLSLAKNINPDDWVTELPKKLNEKYLNAWINEIFMGVGMPSARRAVNDFLSRKAESDMWEQALNKYIKKNGGKKVKIIAESFKEWFKSALKEAIKDQRESIETMVSELYKNVVNHYLEVQEWQIRRIVQTESLSALQVAQKESIDSLGIPYDKTWVISGNNTRPAHAAMDGVTIPEDELFIVDGEEMEFPMDTSYGASAGNIINCACSCIRSPR